MKKRVLILTADAGFGHRRAAEAVQAALNEAYSDEVTTEITNPLDDPNLPDLIKSLETGYDEIVVDDPNLYQLAYSASDAPVVAGLIQRVSTSVLNSSLTRLISRTQPDVIVSTYPAYSQALVRATKNADKRAPVDVIVTDLIGVHSLWFNKVADITFVPSKNVYEQALEHGLRRDQVQQHGLPVSPEIPHLLERNRTELRRALGWDVDLTTALIVGSARARQTATIARLLDRSGLPLQIVAVGGGDEEIAAQLEQTVWQGAVHTYGMVRNMAQMMRAADFIICKAGGLIVSESLASGLPLILYEALPGQEVGNVRYVVENGAGAWSPGALGALATVYSWLGGKQPGIEPLREAAQRIGRPQAAFDIARAVVDQVRGS